jgi:hypothetical protein
VSVSAPHPAGERAALTASIERHRSELQLALEDLKRSTVGRVRSAVGRASPRHQVEERPLLWLAGAFGIGLLVGWRQAPPGR